MRLAGKVALISGGARGMGAVEARLFVQEGARVVIGDVLEAEGRQVEAEISAKGGEVVFVPLDVTSEADWNRAVSTSVNRFGRLDVLVNNAGRGFYGSIRAIDVKELEALLAPHGYRYYLVRETDVLAVDRLRPNRRFRDWLFTKRDASELRALGIPVARDSSEPD